MWKFGDLQTWPTPLPSPPHRPLAATRHSIPDRDRHYHGNVRNRVRYTGETKSSAEFSMKHQSIEDTPVLCPSFPLAVTY